MLNSKADTAVILAAGNGARLSGGKAATAPSKPLTSVAGLPLITRTIMTLMGEGISRFVVITGYRAEDVREYLGKESRFANLDLVTVHNEHWKKANGISVLAARPHLKGKGDFLLLMADHVFQPGVLRAVQAARTPSQGAVLAVDRKIGDVYDLDDATKVLVDSSGQVADIGKELVAFNCIDTGVFKCSHGLFTALEDAREAKDGDCSLSDGIKRLAGQGKMVTCDVGTAWWQDVDTPGSLRHAEKLLFESARKPVDGLISRHFNRTISLRISRGLVNTPVTPNMVSLFTFLLAVLAALAVTRGSYTFFLLGALLMKANSILDGVDGELARVKFQGSKLGQWLDTISVDLSSMLFLAGLTIGAGRLPSGEYYLVAGIVAIVAIAICAGFFYREILSTGEISQAGRWIGAQVGNEGLVTRAFSAIGEITKKDFAVAMFLVMALFGLLPWALYLAAAGAVGTMTVAVVQFIRRRRRPEPQELSVAVGTTR